ncbi:MAG TPA: HAMP domain-containing protein, partial [Blastocatellia bacterium]|nr:HAMP domain-containing protein [Blastocatellia bacterium]
YLVGWKPFKAFDGSTVGAIGVAAPVVEPVITAGAGLRLAGLFAGAGVLLALVIGLLAGRALASRVNSLSDAVTRMSVGELSSTVRDAMGLNGSSDQVRRDEIGRLAAHLDQMRESFRQAIERLRKR